jgi:SOS-response transcriptional repressor LexA
MKVVSIEKIVEASELSLADIFAHNEKGAINQRRKPLYSDLSFLAKNSIQGEFFICTVSGDSMINAGILDGARLVVEVSSKAFDGDIIVVFVSEDLFVKRLRFFNGTTILRSENPNYPDFDASSNAELIIWGIVRLIIQKPKDLL